MTYDNHDKMVVYSFWMTILIVVYHLAPHLIDMLKIGEKTFYKQFFETFGSIGLNYFFAVSAYKFFISSKTYKEKLKKKIDYFIGTLRYMEFIIYNLICLTKRNS